MKKTNSTALIEHGLVAVIAMTLIVVLGWLSFNIKFLSPVARAIQEFSLSDMYYNIEWQENGAPEMSRDITLIDITEVRKRDEIANVIEKVKQCSPAVIGVDIIFEDQNYDIHGDMVLMDVAEASGAIFAYKLTDYAPMTDSFQERVRSYFATDSIKEGYVNAIGDMTATCLRRFSIERNFRGQPQRSFTAQVAEAYSKNDIPLGKTDDRFINYRFIDFPVIKYDSVLANRNLIKDRIVLIGTIGEEADMHFTPLGKRPGLKVQAYSIQTVIDQKNIETTDDNTLMLLSLLICWLTALWQLYWIKFVNSRKNSLWVFLANSNIFFNGITFAWLALLAWLTYIIYERMEYYIPMVMVLASVVLVAEARDIYAAIINGLANSNDTFKKSVYYKDKKTS
ncbi:MAG: CHASE2 domain-containing protein [Bacteroidaceae bacterium]|nr:CHASE2 domain-containing protein [Bacteroidaceae bacterium]